MDRRKGGAVRGVVGAVMAMACAPAPGEGGPGVGGVKQAILDGVEAPEASGVVSVFNQVSIRPCSGALIAPNVVLAPRWCVSEPIAGCCHDLLAPHDPDRIIIGNGPRLNLGTGAGFWEIERIAVPPSAEACGNDLALVVLVDPVAASDGKPLAPRLERGVQLGETITVYGYGASTATGTEHGTRRKRDGVEVKCVADCEGAAPGEWVAGEGPCSADGPGVDLEGKLVGLSSRTAPDCSWAVFESLPPHAAWIRQTVRQASEDAGITAPGWAAAPADGGAESDPVPEPLDPALCVAPAPADAGGAVAEGGGTGGTASAPNEGGTATKGSSADSGGCAVPIAGASGSRSGVWQLGLVVALLASRRRLSRLRRE